MLHPNNIFNNNIVAPPKSYAYQTSIFWAALNTIKAMSTLPLKCCFRDLLLFAFRASSTIVISSDNNKNPNVLTKAPRKNYKNASLKDSKEKLDAISFVFVYLRFCFFFIHTSEEHLAQLQSPFNLKLKYKPRDPTVFFFLLALQCKCGRQEHWETLCYGGLYF